MCFLLNVQFLRVRDPVTTNPMGLVAIVRARHRGCNRSWTTTRRPTFVLLKPMKRLRSSTMKARPCLTPGWTTMSLLSLSVFETFGARGSQPNLLTAPTRRLRCRNSLSMTLFSFFVYIISCNLFFVSVFVFCIITACIHIVSILYMCLLLNVQFLQSFL